VKEGFLCIGRLMLYFLAFPGACQAVDPARPLEELRITRWDQQKGLLQDSLNALAQTPDGFLWVASDEGMIRFDGVEFSVPDEFQKKSRYLRWANCLSVDSRGQLWIGSHGGVYCRTRKGRFAYYDQKSGLPARTPISAVATDAEGTVWAGSFQGGLFWQNGDRFIEYAGAQELRQQQINQIYPVKSGDLWIAASEGLYRINKSTGSVRKLDAKNALPGKPVTAVTIDWRGRLWVGTGEGLAYLEKDVFYPVELPSGDKSGITALFTDSHGMLWIGSRKGGVWRMPPDPKLGEAQFQLLSSLSDDRRSAWISAFCEDTEGDIWVGSDIGLFRISDARFRVYGSREGLLTDSVWAVLASRSGNIWVGTDAGLAFLPGPASTRASLPPPVSPVLSERIRALCEDSCNILWVGTISGALQQFRQEPFSAEGEPIRFSPAVHVVAICEVPPDEVWVGTAGAGLYRFRNGKLIQSFTEHDGIIRNVVNGLALGPGNTLWIAPAYGLLKWRNEKFEDAIPNQIRVHDRVFRSLLVDSDGTVWAGTFDSGLARIRNGSAGGLCTTADGLFSNEFYTLLNDGRGNLWASSNRGIFATKINELNAFFDGRQSKVNCRVFTTADGLVTPEGMGGVANTSCRTGDDRLCFATQAGIAVTSREVLSADSRPPLVVLERFVVNLTQLIPAEPSQPPTSLSADTHSIELHYAGLSLAASETLQYRYKLTGFDPDWVDAGTRRAAYYTNLPPGNYQFHVVTRNRDGIWSPDSVATRFVLQPHFYQTWWFYTLCAVLLCLGVSGLYSWRLQQILQERARLARDLHDTLAQGLVGILWQTESAIGSERKGLRTETLQILERVNALAQETLLEAQGALKAWRTGILAESNSLLNALEHVLKKGTSATPLQTEIRVRGQPFRISSAWEQALIRITQEALTNSLKHAHARRLDAELFFEAKGLTLLLQDDGVGFSEVSHTMQPVSTTSSGLGILGMKERSNRLGGELTIESRAGKGTAIRVIVPASARGRH
jgi:ligand-binding sensor domain-containing protein/two-component sensor histidine kinase